MNTEPIVPRTGEDFMRFTHHAMATSFEVLIAGEERDFAEQCAFAAFEEIDRLERDLSRFLPNSDIARLNNLAPGKSICVGWDTFECLRLSKQYSIETAGAFSVNVGSLMEDLRKGAMGLGRRGGALEFGARERFDMDLIELDQSNFTVSVGEEVPHVDLGAIGKGYAVDRACDLLREWGVANAFVHGGGSSAFAFGHCPGHQGWPVTISSPGSPGTVIEHILLGENALSGSGSVRREHIVDPRKGCLVSGRHAAWVCSSSATESDAISTACMVLEEGEIARYCDLHPGTWAMICGDDPTGGQLRFVRFGDHFPNGQSLA